MEYPSTVSRYPSRLDVADYLDAYAKMQFLDVRINHTVLSLKEVLPAEGLGRSARWRLEVR